MGAKAYVEGDIQTAKQQYGAPGIEWCDDYPPAPGKYDLVILYHQLQLVDQQKVAPALRRYVDCLREDGEIVIVVPSLEWAANQIATKDDTPTLAYISVYGLPNEPARCGFTLLQLRNLMGHFPDLQLVLATDEAYVVTLGQGEQKVSELAHQNVIRCRKRRQDAGNAV
jgi:hypothetical protein